MADTKISALPDAGTLASADVLPLVQGTATHKVSLTQLDSRWVSASSATITGGLSVNPYIAIGTIPAATGHLRLPGNGLIYGKNTAAADVPMLRMVNDTVTLASGSSPVQLGADAAYGVAMIISGSNRFQLNGSGATLNPVLSIGTNPATSAGVLRLPNADYITFRDSTNTYNLRTFGRDATNRIVVGTNDSGGSGLDLRGRPDIAFYSGVTKIGEAGLTYFAFGTNPAQSGIVRLPNDQPIVARNAGNTADVPMFKVGAGGTVQYWNGTAWVDVGGGSGGGTAPGTELQYTSKTTSTTVTATTSAAPDIVIAGAAMTFDGTPVMIEVFSMTVNPPTASGEINIYVWDGEVSIGRVARVVNGGGASAMGVPLCGRFRYTPTAGSHTLSARAHVVGGTGYVGASATGPSPAYLRITKV
jgi:hypothetical protein